MKRKQELKDAEIAQLKANKVELVKLVKEAYQSNKGYHWWDNIKEEVISTYKPFSQSGTKLKLNKLSE